MSKSFEIQGWTIETVKLPILNGPESDAATTLLKLPLPEICFGNNRLRIQNQDGVKFEWNAISALQCVEEESGVKVAHAAEWARGQAASSSSDVTVQKPFDWTYTSLHPGNIQTSSIASTSALPSTFNPAPIKHPGIPIHKLARQDIPIAFYDEVPLFEDELGDNGIAEMIVRVRVNETSFFVLSRFFLRIDHVLFRIFDVRVYHEFGSKEVIRETKGRQAKYQDMKNRLPIDNKDDLTLLTDVNWVSANLEGIAVSAGSNNEAAKWPPTSSIPSLESLSLESNSAENWKGEGVKLEILLLE